MTAGPKIKAAREVADFLDSLGEHKRANDVRALCRSNDSLRTTCSLLHRDNAQLREAKP
jgi:hypothetical protein